MEPTSWDYFTPYHPDAEQALKELQERLFKNGEYEDPLQVGATAGGAPYRPPESIEALRERCGEQGTHSILDIRHISHEPTMYSVSPLSADRVKELFGTDKPELSQFENDFTEASRDETELFDEGENWQGIYLTLYKDGHPSHIFFHGMSGG